MPAPTQSSSTPMTGCRLYHSNALDVLAALLGRELATPAAGAGLLEPDIVLIPQVSMRRWLQQSLAERFGICANLRFLAPGEFVELALDAALGAGDPAQRLAPETMRWRLLAALREPQIRARPALAGIARYLHGDDLRPNAPLLDWSLATDLAQVFERYQAWRRPMLLGWEAGKEPRDWQAELWRLSAGGREHRARRVQRYLDRYGLDGPEIPPGLPSRLFVFACMDVSPDVLQVILSQSRVGEQHAYIHSPCRVFWGDTGIDTYARAYSPHADAQFGGRNPLLASCGLAGRDFIASLGSGEVVRASFETHPFAEFRRDTLLGRLQSDVLDDLAPLQVDGALADAQWPRATVDVHDPSLQLHACHTHLREVQVLHDQLRALLEADPSLQPREIAVLAPEIDAYAPHIAAVFGGAERARFIPYGIAETGTLNAEPLAAALMRLCTLDRQPVTPADIRDLLGVPAVAARFGLQGDAVDAIAHWLDQAGARWGLDADDRARHGAQPHSAYTLQFAIDRLLLGYAAGEPLQIAGTAAWPGLEGRDSDVLDGLLRLLALLRDFARELARPQTPQRWAAVLDRLLVALVGEEPAGSDDRQADERQALVELRRLLQTFADSASLAGFEQRIEPDILLLHLRSEIARPDLRAPLLSGGIAFGRMVPMRLIPFKVIALLGMNADAFPTRDPRGAVDRIAAGLNSEQRRVGDPSHRDADRYLFLQLLTCAERVFYLSWLGADPHDGSAREPSVLVSELLDVAVAYHRCDDVTTAERHRKDLVVHHPLQPFSPAAYGAPLPGEQTQATRIESRRFGFDSRWRAAARHHAQGAPTMTSVFAPARPAARTPLKALDIRELYRFWRDPHADFVRGTLGLRLPQDVEPAPAHEPFGTPDGLAGYALRERIFDAMRAGRDRGGSDADTLHVQLVSEAMLLPGPPGEQQLRETLDELRPYVQLADVADLPPARVLPVDLALDYWHLLGAVDGLHGDVLLRWHLNGKPPHGARWLRVGLDALVTAATGTPAELLMLATDDEKRPPRVQRFPPPTPGQAREGLQRLLTYMEHGRAAPLVFLPRSAWCFHRAMAKDDQAIDKALDAACKQWHGESGGYAEAGLATRIALRGREPTFQQDDPATRDFMETATEVFGALRLQSAGMS